MIRAALFLLLMPQVLLAQTSVQVRSGEHDSFTRLVVRVDPESNWELTESRGQIVLAFPDQVFDFETSGIFARIPKTRILAVETRLDEAASALIIKTACACAANVFAFGDNYLVIDVQNGGPLPEIDEETAKAAPPSAYEYWQPGMLQPAPAQDGTDFFTSLPDLSRPQDIDEPVSMDMAEASPSEQNEQRIEIIRPEQEPDPAMLARIEEAQDQLLQQLTRAADQGLIDFVPPIAEAPPPELIEQSETVEQTAQDSPLDPSLLRQLSARTAYDDAAESDLVNIVNEFAMPQCLDNIEFEMANWSGDADFSKQVSELRSALYGEFDALAQDHALALARLYIVNGLGAEARVVLADLPEEADEFQILNDMATIVDGGKWSPTGRISQGANCGGDHELWYLAGGQGRQAIIATQPIIDAFATYPISVRMLIGPRLANVFLDAGEFDAANTVLEIVRRAAVPDTTPLQMAAANLLESDARQVEANEIFETVAQSQSAESAEATIALAKSALLAHEGIPQSMLTDLEAVVFSQQGTPVSEQARLFEIRVSARVNGLETALVMIKNDLENAKGDHAELAHLVAEIMAEYNASQQGQMTYVNAIIDHLDILSQDDFADKARVVIAAEFITAGLPNIALDILKPALARGDALATLGAAKAHLAQFEPDKALALVDPALSAEAFDIALAAHFQKGDHGAVAALLNHPDSAEFSTGDAAWRAGSWQNVDGDDQRAVMAAFMQNQQQALPDAGAADLSSDAAFLTSVTIDEKPNLQSARQLLEVNRTSRAFIEDALAPLDK